MPTAYLDMLAHTGKEWGEAPTSMSVISGQGGGAPGEGRDQKASARASLSPTLQQQRLMIKADLGAADREEARPLLEDGKKEPGAAGSPGRGVSGPQEGGRP